MYRIDAEKKVHFCDGLSRRDFLHAGSMGLLGLTMSSYYALKAEGRTSNEDRNAIFLFLVGGPSQLDTFDMKPDAPAEIRGPYKPIKTNSPDIQISEIFPRTAKHADKFSIIRSMHHKAAGVHDTGHQMMQTGRLFLNGLEQPHAGCVLGYLRGTKNDMPPHVMMPTPIGPTGGNMPHGQSAGFLGKKFDPFVLNADPSAPDFEVPDLLPPDYISSVRIDRRKNLRNLVDESVEYFESNLDAKLLDESFNQAYTLMSSAAAREAFDLSQEPEKVREKYGMNKFGQSCLLSRRLIERGVRFCTVNMFETVFNEITWDIHGSAPFSPIECYSDLVGPMFDKAYSSLLEDLHQTGLLDSTMVVAMGEFGRTPKINPAGGRDHWPQVWSVLAAGGGVQGGRVVGKTDEIGAYPVERPTLPNELVASVYHSLGIDLETELPSPGSRPVPVVDFGVEPIWELF
ncbi:MAG: DUF1501 domain-containing protein [Candidatus Omnitrophica bacterium]|nr:DUF1501 domain-containing protein [Candidatus Omnitrophota bacterium]MCB9784376.1 DUF1501 domain-containing protein [Candidatus Omnitrophota bacterium]